MNLIAMAILADTCGRVIVPKLGTNFASSLFPSSYPREDIGTPILHARLQRRGSLYDIVLFVLERHRRGPRFTAVENEYIFVALRQISQGGVRTLQVVDVIKSVGDEDDIWTLRLQLSQGTALSESCSIYRVEVDGHFVFTVRTSCQVQTHVPTRILRTIKFVHGTTVRIPHDEEGFVLCKGGLLRRLEEA
jgi:hypothetical protein